MYPRHRHIGCMTTQLLSVAALSETSPFINTRAVEHTKSIQWASHTKRGADLVLAAHELAPSPNRTPLGGWPLSRWQGGERRGWDVSPALTSWGTGTGITNTYPCISLTPLKGSSVTPQSTERVKPCRLPASKSACRRPSSGMRCSAVSVLRQRPPGTLRA